MPDSSPPQPDRWYLPSLTERLILMRWRLLYFIPLLFLIPIVLLTPFFFIFWIKILIIAVALPLTAALNTAKRALKHRTDPFCIHCGYGLTGLPDGHRCPECGETFHLDQIEDYRRDPHWFIKRQKLRHTLPPPDPVFHAGPRPAPLTPSPAQSPPPSHSTTPPSPTNSSH